MKQTILILLYAASFAVFFQSCKKEHSFGDAGPGEISPKITSWFTKQAEGRSAESKTKIAAVQASLELNKSWTEKAAANEMLIIPLKENLNLVNNKKNKVSNYLLLNTDVQTGEILSGYIIQNRPLDKNLTTDLKKGTLQNISEGKAVQDDCVITVLSICDRYLYESSYKNGKLNSTAVMKKSDYAGLTASTATQCIDWFLVTTYYYADGTTYQTSEYVGTTCNNCAIGDPMNESLLCDDGSGYGGSSGGNQESINSFYSYIQKTVMPESFTASPAAQPGQNSGIITWTVVSGAFGSWKVEAKTKYTYDRTRYFLSTGGFIDEFDLSEYNTFTSYYTGTNYLVETTWTPTVMTDFVSNNKSPNAKGKSYVAGILHHKLKSPITLPGGVNTSLATDDTANNDLVFTPR